MVLITLAAIAITGYSGLYDAAAAIRPLPFEYFRQTLLPIGCAHALMLLALRLLPAGKTLGAAAGYWFLSLVVLFSFAGAARSAAFGAALLLLFVCSQIGGSLLRWAAIAPDPALSTAVAISTVSVLATLLVSAGWFKVWVVAPLLFGWATLEIAGSRSAWISRGRSLRAVLKKPIGLAEACAVEIAFLLMVFVIVQASAPEQRSDAVRFYLPYVKLLALTGRFPDIANQWSFVIPQPGLTWTATFQLLFGSMTSRFASPVALAALVWLVASRIRPRAAGLAIACAVASVPLVLWTSTSFMQEAFASLVVCSTALWLADSRTRLSSAPASFIGGILIALTIAAKYMLIVFILPALAVFVVRSLKNRARNFSLGGLAAAAAGGLLAGGPWLWHTAQRTGSALFPFAVSEDPMTLWPSITDANLGDFALPRTLAGFAGAPLLTTFDSSRFIEGVDGTLGIAFLLLCLALPFLLARRRPDEILLGLSAILGAASLWLFTAYGRYWLPAQWLLAMAAGSALARWSGHRGRSLIVAVAAIVVAAQIPIAMAISWRDPAGWAWDFFSRKVSYSSYLNRFGGTQALEALKRIDPEWPRVWFTGFEQIGHFPVIPMEASFWEFRSWHDVRDAESARRHIERGEADYWIVDRATDQARYLASWSVDQRYWSSHRLLFSEGTFDVYWMPSSRRARDAAMRVATQVPTGTLITRNGSFESGEGSAAVEWYAIGEATVTAGAAHHGTRLMVVTDRASAVQRVELDDDVATVRLDEHIRCDTSMLVRLQVNWLDISATTTGTHIDVVRCDSAWRRYTTRADRPADARFAEIFLTSHDPLGSFQVDSVEFRAFSDQ